MKINEIINKMHIESLDAVLILKPENITYLAGFKPSSASFLLLKDDPILFTSKMDMMEAEEQSLIPVSELKSMDEIINILNEDIKVNENVNGKIGVENSLNVQTYLKLSKNISIEPTDLVERARIIKSKDEIRKIEGAIDIAENAMKEIDFSGSENGVAAQLEYNMRIRGSIKPAFETIVASGPRSSLPHASTSSNNLELPIVMDWGALNHNYASDISRTIVGSEKEEEIFEIVLEAQKKAINSIKPGIKASYVDKVARDVINDYDYGDSFIHSTGHGVGLEIHERPSLSTREEGKLEKGMVVTVEPGIYLEGKFGVRIEDMVLIKNKAKVLTKIKKKISL